MSFNRSKRWVSGCVAMEQCSRDQMNWKRETSVSSERISSAYVAVEAVQMPTAKREKASSRKARTPGRS